MKKFKVLLIIAMVAMAAVTANATDRTWVGGTGDWTVGTNWSPAAGGEPWSGDNLLIDSGAPYMNGWMKSSDSGKITIDGGDVMEYGQRIHIGYGGSWGNMDIKSGSLTMKYAGDSSYPKFNVGDQGNGYVNQTGGDVLVDYPYNNVTGYGANLQLAGSDRAGIWHISGGSLTVGKLGNGWDGRGEFKVIGDDAVITCTGETGDGTQGYWQNSRSKLIYEIGTGISKIDATGQICNIGGTLEVSFTEIPTIGERFTLMEYGTLIHGFDSYDLVVDSPLGPDTVDLALHYGDRSDDIMEVEVLHVVPEPAVYSLLFAALALASIRRRRR